MVLDNYKRFISTL